MPKPKLKPNERMSAHYECWALYWFERDTEHSMWFYLMAAWCYEDEDAELALKISNQKDH